LTFHDNSSSHHLGIVQGLTEFIPISSTAHLVFASRLIGLYNGVDATLRAEQTTATIAVIQLGTLFGCACLFCARHYQHHDGVCA